MEMLITDLSNLDHECISPRSLALQVAIEKAYFWSVFPISKPKINYLTTTKKDSYYGDITTKYEVEVEVDSKGIRKLPKYERMLNTLITKYVSTDNLIPFVELLTLIYGYRVYRSCDDSYFQKDYVVPINTNVITYRGKYFNVGKELHPIERIGGIENVIETIYCSYDKDESGCFFGIRTAEKERS